MRCIAETGARKAEAAPRGRLRYSFYTWQMSYLYYRHQIEKIQGYLRIVRILCLQSVTFSMDRNHVVD